jgi:hypothetical protein
MAELLRVRSIVLGLLEQARGRRYVRPYSVLLSVTGTNMNFRQLSSSTEAEVDLILPTVDHPLNILIAREGTFPHLCLEQLF